MIVIGSVFCNAWPPSSIPDGLHRSSGRGGRRQSRPALAGHATKNMALMRALPLCLVLAASGPAMAQAIKHTPPTADSGLWAVQDV